MDTVPDTIRGRKDKDEPETNPKRRSFLVVSLTVFVLVALGIAGAVAYRPLVVWWIQKEARARGVELSFADFTLSSDHVVLQNCRVSPSGLSFVDIEARSIDVTLDGSQPKRVDIVGIVVSMDGPPQERLDALVAWGKTHAEMVDMPLTADGIFRLGPKNSPLITLTGRATSGAFPRTFDGNVSFKGTNLGQLVAKLHDKGVLDLGLGADSLEKAVLRATVETQATPMKIVASVPNIAAADLFRARSLPVPPSFKNTQIQGTTTVFLGTPETQGALTGTSSMVLTMFVPPHPRELDGIVFGKNTVVDTTFEITPDFKEMTIEKATMTAGALKLVGPGTITRDGEDARISLDLKGSLACSEVGASALSAHVGGFVGDLLKGAVRFGIGGTVGVRVRVDADTRALDKAKVDPSVDIRCGLR